MKVHRTVGYLCIFTLTNFGVTVSLIYIDATVAATLFPSHSLKTKMCFCNGAINLSFILTGIQSFKLFSVLTSTFFYVSHLIQIKTQLFWVVLVVVDLGWVDMLELWAPVQSIYWSNCVFLEASYPPRFFTFSLRPCYSQVVCGVSLLSHQMDSCT